MDAECEDRPFLSLVMTTPLSRKQGLKIAQRMKKKLELLGVPIDNVYLFGSLVEGETHRWSDVDIAVVYRPFLSDPWEEHRRIAQSREDFSIPTDIVCLRLEDLENRYSTIAQEVKKHGIPV